MTITRRNLLKGTGAAALGLCLPMPFISKSLAASGKIVAGMEAGSPYDTFYKKHAEEFKAASGVEIEFISIPHDNIRQQFVQDALAGGGSFDVYIADQVWLPEFYQKGFIKDLSGAVTDADKADFSKTAIETVTYDGALVALPIMVHNCAMYYRTDLFEKAGIAGPPKTWDEYRDFAKKTTDAANGIFGTMVCSKQGIEAATRLHAFYQQAGGDLLDPDGKPTINSDAGRAALEFMVALVADKSAPEGVLELPDMQGKWLEGKLAMAPVWPYLYSLSKEPLGGKFAITTSPGLKRPGGTVYSWGFAAASGAKNPDGAVEFIKWATNTDQL
jgi:ABC-type glycerol-3-phosphate transport system substrate-binding protein